MTTRYERITLTDGTRFLLRVDDDRLQWLSGIEVREDGDEMTPDGFTERRRVVAKLAIAKMESMTMNLTYGVLEPKRSTLAEAFAKGSTTKGPHRGYMGRARPRR